MAQNRPLTAAAARKLGWIVERGAYQGTTDDRMDRWYTRHEAAEHIDRRGRGSATKAEALEILRQHLAEGRQHEDAV